MYGLATMQQTRSKANTEQVWPGKHFTIWVQCDEKPNHQPAPAKKNNKVLCMDNIETYLLNVDYERV